MVTTQEWWSLIPEDKLHPSDCIYPFEKEAAELYKKIQAKKKYLFLIVVKVMQPRMDESVVDIPGEAGRP